MQLNPHVMFNGQCEAAFKFYAQCLGGKIAALIPYEGEPAAKSVPPKWRKKIIHASLMVGDWELMGADSPPDRYQQPQGFSVSLGIEKPADAERIFHALAAGGTVRMKLQKTTWSVAFGMLVDKFGIPWMINCEQAPER